MVSCHLQAGDQVLQLADGSQRMAVISRKDGLHLSIVADSLLDGTVDSRKILDDGVSPGSAAIHLLIKPCRER